MIKQFAHTQALLALLRDGFNEHSLGGTVQLRDDGSPVLDYPIIDFVWDGFKRALLSMAEIQFAAGAKAAWLRKWQGRAGAVGVRITQDIMIVRITRMLLLLQLSIALAIAALAEKVFGVDSHAYALLFGMGIVVLIRMLITANNFSLAWRYRSETPEQYQVKWPQACALFFSEFKATILASSWTMPFLRFSRRIANHSATLPVLLIHGYGCNSGYWHAMSKTLTRANITHFAIDMEPVIGGIDEYVPMIHDAVQRVCRETGSSKLIVVAHSMGGLAVRAYLRDHGSARIAKAITLGTPHHGTGLARFGIGLNTRQMLWTVGEQEGLSSAWLRALAANEDKSAYRLIVSLYSHHDNIVSPQTSSRLNGAKNIAFQGIGHVALASHPAIQEQVLHEIREVPHLVAAPAAKASRPS